MAVLSYVGRCDQLKLGRVDLAPGFLGKFTRGCDGRGLTVLDAATGQCPERLMGEEVLVLYEQHRLMQEHDGPDVTAHAGSQPPDGRSCGSVWRMLERSLPWAQRYLDRRFNGGLVDLLEAVAGLNAQTARGPVVGIWARTRSRDLTMLDELCRTFQVVKINVMRGTVHLLTARQYWAWRPALGEVLRRNVGSFCRGIWDRVDYDDLLSWGTDFVSDGRQLTRGDMGQAASQKFSDVDPAHLGFAMRMILPLVEVPAPTMWAPPRTRYVYAPAVCSGRPMEPKAGMADLARSFATAFGSSAVDDFAYWSGLTKTEATRQSDTLIGSATSTSGSPGGPTTVLPEFDNMYFCRRSSDSDLYQAKKDPRLKPAFMPGSLVADGAVVGHWTFTKQQGLRLTPWTDIDASTKHLWDGFADWYRNQDASRSRG